MTGICGIRHNGGKDVADDCAHMRAALKIYGPHRDGQWNGAAISFGIQMFRQLPEDRFDKQPVAAGRFVLVADVRLDNRAELCSQLGWSEERARRSADADLVLAAWERWQDGSLDRLIGDWAVAVWDAAAGTLTLARDMMGNRPLFYHHGRAFFAFSSMAKGLHALKDVPVGPDLETLRDYLALAPTRGPGSFFKGIARVEPGGKAVLTRDGTLKTSHWYDWTGIAERPVRDDRTCVEEFRGLFDRVISDHLRSAGPVASFLSAGLDSTAVTVTAARLLGAQEHRLAAYTHVPTRGFEWEVPPGRVADEGPMAAATAAGCANIDHHLIDSGDSRIGGDLDLASYYNELPILNLANAVWVDDLVRHARDDGNAVLLTGRFGNQVISTDGLERLHELACAGRWLVWFQNVMRTKLGFATCLHATFGPWLSPRMYARALAVFGRKSLDLSSVTGLRQDIIDSPAFRDHLEACGHDPSYRPHRSVRHVAEFVLRRYDSGGQVNKGQLARYGIAVRDPLADRRLIEFALSLPSRMWLQGGETKWLYRQAFADCVPAAVMRQKRRGYQGADWPERLRRSKTQIDEEIARAESDPDIQRLFDTDYLEQMRCSALPADLDEAITVRNYRQKYLRSISVAHFIRRANRRN